MMQVFLISEKTLKSDSLVNNNVDGCFISAAIRVAQDQHLHPILGTNLYRKVCKDVIDGTLTEDYKELLDDYITPYLEYRVMADIQIPLNYKLRNSGVTTNTDEHITAASLEELKYLTDYYENKAAFYCNRLSDYLCANCSKFPEYHHKQSCADMCPDRRTNTIINLH